MKAEFDTVLEQGLPPRKVSVFETHETARGRQEKRTGLGHAPENEARFRRFAWGLLKQHPNDKLSVAIKRRNAGWDGNFLAEVVFGMKTECDLALPMW